MRMQGIELLIKSRFICTSAQRRIMSEGRLEGCLTYDEGCTSKQADVQELDAPVADPLDPCPAHQQVELPERARDRPVAALLAAAAAARHPAPAQQEVHPCAYMHTHSYSLNALQNAVYRGAVFGIDVNLLSP